MPRRWKQTFNCKPLEELAGQLVHSPPLRRAEQCSRAEKLHDQIDPQINYPLDYIAYRLTRYRLESRESVLLVGQAVRPDLRLIIDMLSRCTDIQPADAQAVESTQHLASRLNVSAKTIARWRQLGLRWRWAKNPHSKRKQVVFDRAAIDKFIAEYGRDVKRAADFLTMKDKERNNLIARARRIAQVRQVSLNQMASHLARRTGRAVETVRQILEKHDASERDHPIFADRTGPLTGRQRRIICRAFRMGVPVNDIARKFGRTSTTVYRTIKKRRADAARRINIKYISSPTFARDDADEVILRPSGQPQSSAKPETFANIQTDDLPQPLADIYHQPIIEPEQSRSLFVRYNYLKYKAVAIRAALVPSDPRTSDLDEFALCLSQARTVRDVLARSALPTVLSVARRHLLDADDPASTRLMQLLALGNRQLADAIDSFNPNRSQTFVTFLTNTLLQLFVSESDQADSPPRRARSKHHENDLLQEIIRTANLGNF